MLFLLPALPSLAQDKTESFDLGGDRFIAGRIAAMSEPGGADVFLAGERVTLEAEITGSAHMAGRWVTVSGPVGQGLYAAGQEVRVGAAVLARGGEDLACSWKLFEISSGAQTLGEIEVRVVSGWS